MTLLTMGDLTAIQSGHIYDKTEDFLAKIICFDTADAILTRGLQSRSYQAHLQKSLIWRGFRGFTRFS